MMMSRLHRSSRMWDRGLLVGRDATSGPAASALRHEVLREVHAQGLELLEMDRLAVRRRLGRGAALVRARAPCRGQLWVTSASFSFRCRSTLLSDFMSSMSCSFTAVSFSIFSFVSSTRFCLSIASMSLLKP